MTVAELSRKIGEIEPQISRNDERIKKNDERLTKVEDELKDQRKLLVVIERMANGLEAVQEKVNDICTRVHNIEEKPGKRWETLVGQIIGLLVAGAIGYLLSRIGL